MASKRQRFGRTFARSIMLTLTAGTIASAQGPPPEWTFSLGARESNQFDRVTNGVAQPDVIMDNFNARLGVSDRGERSRYGFFGLVGYNYYREGRSRDRYHYGAGFGWDHQPSSRLSSNLSLAFNRGFSSEKLSTIGELAPDIENTSGRASWGIQYQSGARTWLSTGIAYRYVLVESPESIPGSQIVLDEPPFQDDFPPLLTGPPDEEGDLVLPDAEQDVLDIIATEGFAGRRNESHWATARFGLSHQLTQYTSTGFDLAGGYRTVERGELEPDVREGATAGFRYWADKRIGQSANMGASYMVWRSLVSFPENTVHTATAGFGYFPRGRRWSLRVSGGASYYQAESIDSTLTPIVDAFFNKELTRSTRFSAAYRRQFSQSLGFGATRLIDYGTVALTQDFGTKVDLSLRAGASLSRNPLIEDSRSDAVNAGAVLTYRVVRSLALGTSFFVLDTRRDTLNGTSESSRNLWTLFIRYTAQWN